MGIQPLALTYSGSLLQDELVGWQGQQVLFFGGGLRMWTGLVFLDSGSKELHLAPQVIVQVSADDGLEGIVPSAPGGYVEHPCLKPGDDVGAEQREPSTRISN